MITHLPQGSERIVRQVPFEHYFCNRKSLEDNSWCCFVTLQYWEKDEDSEICRVQIYGKEPFTDVKIKEYMERKGWCVFQVDATEKGWEVLVKKWNIWVDFFLAREGQESVSLEVNPRKIGELFFSTLQCSKKILIREIQKKNEQFFPRCSFEIRNVSVFGGNISYAVTYNRKRV